MRWRHWLRRLVVTVLTVLLILTAAIWFISRSNWGHGKIRGLIESQARNYLAGTLHIDQIRPHGTTIFSGVTLVGVRYEFRGRDVLTARSIDVNYSVIGWLRGERRISLVRLVDPVIRITEANGVWEPGAWLKPRPAGPPPTSLFYLPQVEIVNGRVETAASEGLWRVPALITAMNGELRFEFGRRTRIEFARLAFLAPAYGFDLRKMTGAITMENGTRIDKIHMESTRGTLDVDGRVESGTPRPFAVQASLTGFDTTAWRAWSPLMDVMRFTATGPATIDGTTSRIRVDAALATSTGRAKTETYITPGARGTRIEGKADLVGVDLEPVLNSADWKTVLTGHTTFVVVSAATPGKPSSWTSSMTFAGGPVRAFGAVVDRIDGKGRYANKRVYFDGSATAYGTSARIDGDVFTGSPIQINVHGTDLIGLDVSRLPAEWEFPALVTEANAKEFTATWTKGQWRATATLNDSMVEGTILRAGTVVEAASTPAGVSVTAEGDIRTLNARQLGRALKLTGLDDPFFETSVTGHVALTGQGANWKDIDVTGRATVVDSRALKAGIPSGAITFSRQSHHMNAVFSGPIMGFSLVTLGAPVELDGSINGQLDVTIDWRDDVPKIVDTMTAQLTLRATASDIAKFKIDRGVVTGRWVDGGFTAQTIDLEGAGLKATARGRFAIQRGESRATFELDAEDSNVFKPWTDYETVGAAKGEFTLTGAFDRPRVTGTFESEWLSGPDIGTFTRPRARIDVELPEWDIQRVVGPVALTADRWTSDAAVIDKVETSGDMLSGTALRGVLRGQYQGFDFTTSGLVDWATIVRADVASFTASRGATSWSVAPGGGKFFVTEEGIEASNVTFVNGPQRIAVDGRLAWIDAARSSDRITARATSVDLKSLDEFLALNIGMAGQLTGDLTLLGRLSDPRGRIVASAKDLTIRGYTVTSFGGTIDLAAGGATVNLLLTQPDGVTASVIGRAPLAYVMSEGTLDPGLPTPDWDLAVVTDPINLAIIGTVSPLITNITGQALVDVTVVGPAATPRLNGSIAVADGKFDLPSAGTTYSKVAADISFAPDKVTVKRFVLYDRHDHTLKITGDLAVSEQRVGDFNVSVEADRVELLNNEIGDIELSSLMTLSGGVSKPTLSGNIEVVSGRVEVDRLLRALQGDPLALVAELDLPAEGVTPVDLRKDAQKAAEAAAKKKPSASAFDSKTFLSQLAVDVQLFAPDNLILRGSDIRPAGNRGWSLGALNATVGGDLQIQRNPGETARILGDVTTIRGGYTFQGRRFEIERGGHIRFSGQTPIDPTFDVRGVRDIQGVEARVDVRGSLSAPELRLGSNAALGEADILSMIVFNRPVNQLGDTQRADLVGVAATVAGGMVTAPLTDRLGKALNLDLLEVETVTFGENVAPRVRVGQHLTTRLFVQLVQQFGAQSLSELTAEFQIARYLRLQASTAQGPGSRAQRSLLQRAERFGLDLIFFFNY